MPARGQDMTTRFGWLHQHQTHLPELDFDAGGRPDYTSRSGSPQWDGPSSPPPPHMDRGWMLLGNGKSTRRVYRFDNLSDGREKCAFIFSGVILKKNTVLFLYRFIAERKSIAKLAETFSWFDFADICQKVHLNRGFFFLLKPAT